MHRCMMKKVLLSPRQPVNINNIAMKHNICSNQGSIRIIGKLHIMLHRINI
jgi:hypothetical protein